MAFDLIDLEVVRRAQRHDEPYPYFTGAGFINKEEVPAIQASFPDLKKTGFHPASDMVFEGAFAKLMNELESDELAEALSEKLGEPLNEAARFITIRKVSAAHEGRIHCDGEAKVGNFLIYLNDDWSSPEGRLRVLRRQDSFDDYVAEIDPKTGSVFGFLRRDYSWHGHKPFVGERRVIQIAWLRGQADIDRKTKRHRLSNVLKGIFGG